ncbi:WGR domain-containing protein [Chroococcidiopsis sp. SAG 2025]|uniref:WGR domain-containing protein n=1 Tax=Chroococcidiopsis sp. SAG 2025 TaxID=171389 RepID=UPI0039779D3A
MSIRYTHSQWCFLAWKREHRYYRAELRQDLFGNWIVMKMWGRIGSRLGGMKETLCRTYEEADSCFQTAVRRRERRGYTLQGRNP